MTPQAAVVGLFVVIVVQRLAELRLAARNEAWARDRGGEEHGRGHYPLFFVLHTGWLLAWPAEAMFRGPHLASSWMPWLGVFLAAQVLRYWAIGSLGHRWNTKILVIPGLPPVRAGPYRVLRHPNYLAVVAELAAVPLVFGAWWTAAAVGILNAVLLGAVRIPAENSAIDHALARGPAASALKSGGS